MTIATPTKKVNVTNGDHSKNKRSGADLLMTEKNQATHKEPLKKEQAEVVDNLDFSSCAATRWGCWGNDLPLPLERFYYWEKTAPHKLFMSQPFGEGRIVEYSWQQVANESRRMAAHIKSLELPIGSRIAILSKNCAHWIMSDLAIWLAGHVSVPLYPTLTAETIGQILNHSESKVLFVGKLDHWDSMEPGVPKDIHCISYPLSPKNNFKRWDDIIAETLPLDQSPKRGAEELSTIIYTSGTTGMPKGVMHTFGTIAACAAQLSKLYTLSPSDRVLSYLPLSHVAERLCVEMGALYEAFTVFFAESLETFTADLQRASPTIFFAVPRIWTKFQQGILAKVNQKKLNRLLSIPILNLIIKRKLKKALGLSDAKLCISGAAPIAPALLSWYKQLGIDIFEAYGMTENFAYSHGNRPGFELGGSVGQGNPGVVTKIGPLREILVKSPATMVGYYKQPEQTAAAIDDEGFLHTGDVGEISPEGYLKITGRVKEIFKSSKGKYIAPAPIETKLLSNPLIEQACVVGANMTQPIVLVVLPEALQQQVADQVQKQQLELRLLELLEKVNGMLDPHERLKSIIVVNEEWTVENNCLTPTLKVKRNIVENLYQSCFEQWSQQKDTVVWMS